MFYGCGYDIIDNFNRLTISFDIRFFWLPLSIMKCSEAPFTHICEWNRHSASSDSSGSSCWIWVVGMVALGSTSMIYFPLPMYESKSESGSNFEAFSSVTNDCFVALINVVPGDFMKITPLLNVFYHLSITLLSLGLRQVIWRLVIFVWSFDLHVRATFARLLLWCICISKLPLIALL